MSIQGSINQLLSMAAVGVRLSPSYETMQKRAALKRAEMAGRKRIETIESEFNPENTLEESAILRELQARAGEQQSEVLTAQFELDPTKETLAKAITSRQAAKNLRRMSESAQEALNARQTEVRGPRPTITQQLRENKPVQDKLVESFKERMRGKTNGNNE